MFLPASSLPSFRCLLLLSSLANAGTLFYSLFLSASDSSEHLVLLFESSVPRERRKKKESESGFEFKAESDGGREIGVKKNYQRLKYT